MIRHVLGETNHITNRIVKMIFTDMEGANVMAAAPIKLIVPLDSDKASGAFDFVSLV